MINKGIFNKILLAIAIILVICSFYNMAYQHGKQRGMKEAWAFEECVKELGCGCNPETEKPYIEEQKHIWGRTYPICFEFEDKGARA